MNILSCSIGLNAKTFVVRAIALLLGTVLLMSSFAMSANAQTYLEPGQRFRRELDTGEWAHFRIYVDDWHTHAQFSCWDFSRRAIKGNPDIYIRFGQQPTLTEWDFRPFLRERKEIVDIDGASAPEIRTGFWYVSIHARSPTTAFIEAELNSATSAHGGMGATPVDGGTAFRVWAPNADSVNLVGPFNGWNDGNCELVSEGNGNFSLDVRNVGPGMEYQYVIRNGTQTLWRKDPREQRLTNSVGNSIIFDDNFNWTDQGFQMPSWNETVIYEMHVGTFNDDPGGRPGTFDDAIARLDHLQDLGVNAICVMPFNEFAGDYSWGYNPAYPFAVEEAYGGPDALRRFVDAAHARGIAVLADVVHNHWGPSDLGLWVFDGWSQNGRGGIYFYQDERADTQWGNTRPDFGRGEVRTYIRDSVMMWLTDFHFDGIRWDSVQATTNYDFGQLPDGWSLMQWINNEIDYFQPWSLSIAEDLQGNPWVTKTTGEGGAGFDSQWDAGFVHPVRAALQGQNDNDRNMWDIKSALENRYNGDAFERVIYTESHDEVANGRSRVPEEIWPGNAGSWFSRKRSTLGGALVMTAPGIPMMFQGQEILEDEYFRDTDPVDWSKEITYAGIEAMYRDLIRQRRNWYDQTRGLRGQHINVFHVNNGDKMIAFHRWDQGGPRDDVIVVANFRDTTWQDYRIGLPRGGQWKVRFNSDWDGYSPDFGSIFVPDVTADNWGQDGLNHSASIKIAPYAVLILSQD
ncbi:MAG: alpha-amylase family glycosyl hydrolase [Planctomycetota bacterium]